MTMSRASSVGSPPASAARLDHEQPDRVRALVDRGDATGPLLRVDRAPPAPRPTGRSDRRRPPGGTRSARAGTSRRDACRRRRRPPRASGRSAARSSAYDRCAASNAWANAGSERSRSLNRAIAPAASRRATAFTASGHVSQYVVGNGAPDGVARRVADHERMPSGAAHHDRERRGGLASELLAHGRQVGRAELAVGRSRDGAHADAHLGRTRRGDPRPSRRHTVAAWPPTPTSRAPHRPSGHPPVPPRGRGGVRRVPVRPGRGSLPELGRVHARAGARRSSPRWRRSTPACPASGSSSRSPTPSSDELLGDAALCVDADDPSRAELGFTFAPAHQGKGYATEAVRATIDYAFERLGVEIVVGDHRRAERSRRSRCWSGSG